MKRYLAVILTGAFVLSLTSVSFAADLSDTKPTIEKAELMETLAEVFPEYKNQMYAADSAAYRMKSSVFNVQSAEPPVCIGSEVRTVNDVEYGLQLYSDGTYTTYGLFPGKYTRIDGDIYTGSGYTSYVGCYLFVYWLGSCATASLYDFGYTTLGGAYDIFDNPGSGSMSGQTTIGGSVALPIDGPIFIENYVKNETATHSAGAHYWAINYIGPIAVNSTFDIEIGHDGCVITVNPMIG